MKSSLIIAFTAFFLTSCIGAGDISDIKNNGESHFPSMVGIDLMGEDKKIPESFKGKYNIVAVAFKHEHQADVNSWITVADNMLAKNSNIKFYEIPLIYEINAPYRFWVNNGMRSGIPDLKARLRTITVYTDREEFLDIMNMKTDDIYILLLDNKGKIIWQTKGPSDTRKIKELEVKINNLN